MSEPMPGGRRRVDRVLDPSFLDGLADLSLDGLRDRRAEAEQEEADLSYVRRLLQGRIDLVRAEQSRRSGEASGSIVDRLAEILADSTRSTHGSGRHITVEPSRVDDHRRHTEALAADAGIFDVTGRSDEELAQALARLTESEQMVSGVRRRVQDVMDSLTAEVTRRYRDGEADVANLLAET